MKPVLAAALLPGLVCTVISAEPIIETDESNSHVFFSGVGPGDHSASIIYEICNRSGSPSEVYWADAKFGADVFSPLPDLGCIQRQDWPVLRDRIYVDRSRVDFGSGIADAVWTAVECNGQIVETGNGASQCERSFSSRVLRRASTMRFFGRKPDGSVYGYEESIVSVTENPENMIGVNFIEVLSSDDESIQILTFGSSSLELEQFTELLDSEVENAGPLGFLLESLDLPLGVVPEPRLSAPSVLISAESTGILIDSDERLGASFELLHIGEGISFRSEISLPASFN